MCSKCYRDVLKKEQDQARKVPSIAPAPVDVIMTPSEETTSLSSAVQPSCAESSEPKPASEADVISLPDAPRAGSSSATNAADNLSLQSATTASHQEVASPNPVEEPATSAVPVNVVAMASAAAKASPEKKQNPGRCLSCNKKVGLLGFQCRCGFVFCGQHRYADAHECAFDYKTFEREQLRLKNPEVTAAKIEKF